MKLHGSARTCPNSRRLIASRVLEQGWTLAAAAEAAGVSVVTARKWVGRFGAGDEALCDRSSRPRRIERLSDSKIEAIIHLRRLRMTAAEIAESLGLAAVHGLTLAQAGGARQALASGPARASQPL